MLSTLASENPVVRQITFQDCHCSNPLPVSHPQTQQKRLPTTRGTRDDVGFCAHMKGTWLNVTPQINWWGQYISCSSGRNKLFSLNSPVYQKGRRKEFLQNCALNRQRERKRQRDSEKEREREILGEK